MILLPAARLTEFKEFDDPQLPEPGTGWIDYKVELFLLSSGEEVLIAIHEKAPDKHTIEFMINMYR